MKEKLRKYSLLFLFLLLQFSLFAQVNEEEVVVEKERQIELPQKQKSIYEAKTPEIKREEGEQNYDFGNFDYGSNLQNIDIQFPEAQDSSQITPPLETYKKGYIKLGGGNFSTLYGEVFWEHAIDTTWKYALNLTHLSSNTGPVGTGNYSAQSTNRFDTYVNRFSKKGIWGLDLGYRRNGNRFYGYDFQENNPNLGEDSLLQVTNRFYATLSYRNFPNDSTKFQYDLQGKFKYWNNSFDYSEIQGGLEAFLVYDFSENLTAKAETKFWFTEQTQNTSLNRNYIAIKPTVTYRIGKFWINAGLNFVWEDDTTSTAEGVYVMPIAKIGYRFADYLQVSAGVQGDVQRTTLYEVTDENPFLGRNALMYHTQIPWQFFFKAEGTPNPNLTYSVYLQWEQFKNLYFYLNNPLDTAKFILAYEPEGREISRVSIGGEIAYNFENGLTLEAQAIFYNYEMNTFAEPWHRPEFEGNFNANYIFSEKFNIGANLYFAGGITAFNFISNEDENLEPIIDLSLGGNYQFKEKWSAFLHLNNLLSTNYQRYLHYPQQGFNILIGLTYAF